MWRVVIAGALSMAPLSSALAWGDQEHRIICEIAFREVAVDTRDKIKALISGDAQFQRFADSCTWPDHPRKRDDEHFVNLPRDATALGSDPCPLADRCVVTAVEKDIATLSSPTASDTARLIALKFLGHFTGDLHQPLHVSFRDDRGGNSVDSTGTCGSNMHSAWDTCLLQKAVGTDPQAAVTALEGEITAADRAAWIASEPADWANESFAITIAAGTKYCVAAGGACRYEAGNVELDQDEPEKQVAIDAAYVAMSTPIIRDRLKRAGVRLAHVLDGALGD